ncbi:putative snurportin-1 [Helianthus annuus]|nr:putative snurportin-1 [Helianthus annuus]KAJ0529375.1 putative snurportin-1 [Helianthus annuus]KAJ0696262.1 putative snurportin-1 [Helianthus annuus]
MNALLSSDFFWMNNKLVELGACEAPSTYHRYRFSLVPVYSCDHEGLQTPYTGAVPYLKDGLLFYNKHADYQMGNTSPVLVWKDESCSQYVIGIDNKGQVPNQQQTGLRSGKVHRAYAFADSYYIGKVHRACTFAESYFKIVFQYIVRHSPLWIEHLFASAGVQVNKRVTRWKWLVEGLILTNVYMLFCHWFELLCLRGNSTRGGPK